MNMPPPGLNGDALLNWRLGELERHFEELRDRSEGWHNTLAVGQTTLQTQFLNFRKDLDDVYTPRREATQRHDVVNGRIAELERKSESCMSQREAQDAYKTLGDRLDKFEVFGREYRRDHDLVHKEANEAHTKMWQFSLSLGVAFLGMLLNAFFHFIPGSH